MGEKDLAQKNLEFFPDVFADCVNALLYKGEQVLQEEKLLPAPTETAYPDEENVLHNQFQDISKYEVEGSTIQVQYTLENQTDVDRKMVLREFGYKGAIYRRQYQGKELYPVLSILLYWGKPQWQSPRSLRELMEGRHSDLLSDRKLKGMDKVQIRVYEMAHLPKKVRQRFHSDMRIIVDYLAEEENYLPTEQKIMHVEAFLRMMKILTGDNRYEEMLLQMTEEEREESIGMCKLLDKYWNDGVEKGKTEGEIIGIAKGEMIGAVKGKAESVGIIRSMCRHKMSAEAIAELVSQKLDYINQIITLCSQYPAEDDISIAKRLLSEN